MRNACPRGGSSPGGTLTKRFYLHLHWMLPAGLATCGDADTGKGVRGIWKLLADELDGLGERHRVGILAQCLGRRRLHLLLAMPTHLAVARWVLLAKMSTSRLLSRELGRVERWPAGYGLRSLSPSHLAAALDQLRLLGALRLGAAGLQALGEAAGETSDIEAPGRAAATRVAESGPEPPVDSGRATPADAGAPLRFT